MSRADSTKTRNAPRRRPPPISAAAVSPYYHYGGDDYGNHAASLAWTEEDTLSHSTYSCGGWDPAEERRQRRMKRMLAHGREESPWSFIKGLCDEAFDFFVDECQKEMPSWVDEWYIRDNLEFALHREVTSWNVQESVLFDKDGKEEARRYVKAEFQVSIRWQGKLHSDKIIDFQWANGKFEDVGMMDLSTLSDLVKELNEIPEDAGFKEESVLD